MPHSNDCNREKDGGTANPLVDAFIDLWLENVAAWSLQRAPQQELGPGDEPA